MKFLVEPESSCHFPDAKRAGIEYVQEADSNSLFSQQKIKCQSYNHPRLSAAAFLARPFAWKSEHSHKKYSKYVPETN